MILYHHSPKENRESIQQNGLQTKYDGTGDDSATKVVFLIDTPTVSETSDIWEVNVDGLELDEDVMWSGNGKSYMCTSDIPPDRLNNFDAELERLVGWFIQNRQQIAVTLNVDEIQIVNERVIGIKRKVNKHGEVKVQVKTLEQMR